MNWILGLAIYAVIWSTVLFAVLPWGVRTQQEAGEIVKGSAESAPVNPRLGMKVLATTLVAGVIFGIFYLALAMGWLDGLVLPPR
jgi:predicted secreted protein